MKIVRDGFGDHVDLGVAHAEHSAYVADNGFCGERSEGGDAADMIFSVFFGDVFDDLSSAIVTEVRIKVGHADALGVQKTLEHQVETNGVNVRDANEISDKASRTRASPGTRRDGSALCIANKVGDDQIIFGISHARDDGKLIFYSFSVDRFGMLLSENDFALGDLFIKALQRQTAEIIFGCFSRCRTEAGKIQLGKVKIKMAKIGDLLSIFDCFRITSEKRGHFFLALHIEFIRFKAEGSAVGNLVACLNAHQNGLRVGIVAAEIMHVVGGDERDPRILGELQQLSVNGFLLRDAVILYFEIIAVLSEQLLHGECVFLCFIIFAVGEQTGNISRQTSGKADQALAVLLKQFQVDTWLGVEAFRICLGDHVDQIFISDFVFDEEDEMIASAVRFMPFVKTGSCGNVDLASDDRLDAVFLAGAVKIHDAVHGAVIGDGNCRLTQLRCPSWDIADTASAVKQAVFTVQMKMNERHSFSFPADHSASWRDL